MDRGKVLLQPTSLTRGLGTSAFQWIRFVGDPGSSDPEPSIDRWMADLVAATEPLGDRAVGDPGVMGYFRLADRTIAIALQHASSKQTLLVECDRLARRLEDDGCVGTLQGAPSARPPWLRHHYEHLYGTAVVGSITTRPWRPPDGNVNGTGRVMCDQAALHAVVEHAVSWCTVPGGTYAVSVGEYTVRTEASRAGDLFRYLVDHTGETVNLICSDYPTHTRIVSLDYQARARYSDGRTVHLEPRDPGGPEVFPAPEVSLALATDLLTTLAPHLSYGFALQAALPGAIASHLLNRRWPTDRPMRNMRAARRWETTGGWDAFAVLLHGPDFPPVTTDGPYAITNLGHGRRLLTHHDATRLINGSGLTPTDLADGRAQLGDALIDLDAVQHVINAWLVHRGDPGAISVYGTGPLIPDDHPMKTW